MNFLLKNSMNIILLSILIIGTLAVFSGFNDKFSDVPPFNDDNKRVVTVEAFSENFCKKFSSNPKELRTPCNQLGKTGCPTVSCCVLLNGKKCVPGNKSGPIYHTENGIPIENKYFYYKGKCYNGSKKCPK